MGGDVSFYGELENKLTKTQQDQYIAKFKINNYPYEECSQVTFYIDDYDTIKWKLAKFFGYLYPEKILHEKAITYLKNSYGKVIDISLISEPKEIGKCEFYIDGMSYRKFKDKIYIEFYYELESI